MANVVRIALCQLECHPSFIIDKLAFLEEPFVPSHPNCSLSSLAAAGIPGITKLKTLNKKQYLDWHSQRIQHILSHPLFNDEMPLLIAFPEGSIPIESLPSLAQFANKTDSIVIAGTHSLQRTIDAKRIYTEIGKGKSILKNKSNNGQVSFVFNGSRIHTRNKQAPSVFEHTDTSGMIERRPELYSYTSNIKESKFNYLPLICAEALLNPNIQNAFSILSIISYSNTPHYFDSFIDSQAKQGKICTYVNDGKIGQSLIKFPRDNRNSSWFFDDQLSGRLPKGDSILVIDVCLDNLAPRVGIVNPGINYQLKLLASVTYRQSSLQTHLISEALLDIKQYDQCEVRHKKLSDLIRYKLPDPSQKARLYYLQELTRNGTDNERHWNCYANDFIIDQPGLSDLESNLAKACYDSLLPLLAEDTFDPKTQNNLKAFVKCSKNIASSSKKKIAFSQEDGPIIKQDTINRDFECNRILTFLDNNNEAAIQITGLLNIGKSSTILKALSQTGLHRINKIEIEISSTIQYIFQKLLGNELGTIIPDDTELFNLLSEEGTRRTILEWDILWFENCEFLFSSGGWRSSETEKLFHNLLLMAKGSRTKLIFETTHELQFNLEDPSIVGKLRIGGFEGTSTTYGITLLNQQFRRLGLPPTDLNETNKEEIINKIGGHPLAIIYFADAVYEDGYNSALNAITTTDGLYKKAITKILRHISLTKDQIFILQLLGGSKYELHRDLISAVCDFAAHDHITSLIKQCLIEPVGPNTIKLPGVLIEQFRFSKLSTETRTRFHKEALKFYTILLEENPSKIEYAVAAELHSSYIGEKSPISSGLLDSQIEFAHSLYNDRNYSKAKLIIDKAMDVKRTIDIIRLSTLIEAELGNYESVMRNAEELFSQTPNDAYLFQRLCKITLTQNRVDITERLVSLAQGSSINETSIFIVQGDIARRRKRLDLAEWYYR